MARNPRSVRFPVSLEQQVERWAAANGVAFNKAVVELCARQLAAQDSVAGQAVTRQGCVTGDVLRGTWCVFLRWKCGACCV